MKAVRAKSSHYWPFFGLVLVLLVVETTLANQSIISKPILFLHGVGGHASEFDDIIAFVQEKYGDQAPPMHSLDICEGTCSLFTSMTEQRDTLIEYLQDNAEALNISQGFHWVAHSQGAVLARSAIQEGLVTATSGIRPHVFVSMAGPQMGQWGECTMNRTDIPEAIAKKMTRRLGWVFFYNAVAQHELSIASYWHDPNHLSRMIEKATLLPALNGYDPAVDMSPAKKHFLQLDKAVFVGSPDDDCINPPLSSVFQFVDGNGTLQSWQESLEFQNDTFGLQSLWQDGRLVRQSVPGLDHLSWRLPKVFEQYVLPHLLDTIEIEEE